MNTKSTSSPIFNYSQAIEQFTLLGYKAADKAYVRFISPRHTPTAYLESKGLTYIDKKTNKPKFVPINAYIDLATNEFYRQFGKDYKLVTGGWDAIHALNQKGLGEYLVVNGGGQVDKDVTKCKAIFIEHDDISKEEQMVLWRLLGLPEPTFQLDTGGKSIHSYWVFNEPIAVDLWEVLIADLIKFAGADKANKNPSRVMRLAGFNHYEWDIESGEMLTNEVSTIVTKSGNKYSYDELRAVIPTELKTEPQPKPKKEPKPKSAPSSSPPFPKGRSTSGGIPPIPLQNCLTRANRSYLMNGVVYQSGESRDCIGAALARDLIGTANYLDSIGRLYQGTARELFDDEYCVNCNPPLTEEEDKISGIWVSAVKDNPEPGCNSNGDEIGGVDRILDAWDKKHSNDGTNDKESKKNPPELWIADDFNNDVLKDLTLFDTNLKKYWQYNGKGVWESIDDEYMFKKCLDYLTPIVPAFNPRYVDNIIRFAKSKILTSGLDEPSNLKVMPFGNGVLNIETKELAPHTPTNKFTWQLPRNYSPEKTDWNEIKKFISSSLNDNQQLVELAIAICNAVLIGRYDLQKSFVLKGSGRNGKGAFMKLLTMLVGEVNRCSTSMKTLNENNFEVANLFNKRLAIMPDEDKQAGSVSIFKKVVGGDELRAERKYEHPFSFQFKGIIVIAANQPIFISEKGLAVQERLVYLPFDKFIKPEDRIDLVPIFNGEMEAFTNYLLSLDNDDVKKTINNANNIKAVSDLSWDIMVESDSIAAFYDEKLIAGTAKGDTINSGYAYELYKDYCETNGLKAKAQKTFGTQLIEVAKSQGATVTRHRSKDGVAFIGIRRRTDKDIDDKVQELDPEVTYVDWDHHRLNGKLDPQWR